MSVPAPQGDCRGDLPMPRSKIDNYRSARGANAYKQDYQDKLHRRYSDKRERKIFARLFEISGPCQSILDLPCGAGRLLGLFRDHAAKVYEADFSPSMLRLNRDDHRSAAAGYTECSGLEIPFTDHSLDLVASIRLSHHLEQRADRHRHLSELFRVARKAVIVSWFSHTSLKNRLRQLRAPFNKKKPKNTLRTREVQTLAADHGFRTAAAIPLSRFGSGHVIGLFLRD